MLLDNEVQKTNESEGIETKSSDAFAFYIAQYNFVFLQQAISVV
ncbi:hypothetical protein SDC9_191477 [bioreactor metagenome]|uniref:Uncharacterized protein n=1 Tax=bioreactor metagenome TaxID=1076179 RepID=A0A645HZA1_9ZZZZ